MNKFFLCFATALFFLNSIQAHEPYYATVQVDIFSDTVKAPNLVDLKRKLSTLNIQEAIPIYTPNSFAAITFNVRGIEVPAFFPENSASLVVSIPQIGVLETFNGTTREDSLILFKDFLNDGGNRHKLFKAYAKFSPIDPIAGNPNSLQNQMAQADYLLGRLSPLTGCCCDYHSQPIVNQYQIGLEFGRAFSKSFDTTVVTIPLRYSFSPNLTWAFILDAPFSYLRNGGASSVVGSLGLGVRFPLTQQWSITPIFRGGFGGTLDLCTSGSFISAGLTSCFDIKIKDFVFSMINYAGYSSSVNFWLTGINFTYHLHNYIFKNGFSITSCKGFSFCDYPINLSFSFEDSYFAKDPLYIKHYDEIGVSLIANCLIPYFEYDCLTLKLTYQFGDKSYRGYFCNLTYQF